MNNVHTSILLMYESYILTKENVVLTTLLYANYPYSESYTLLSLLARIHFICIKFGYVLLV